MTFCAYKWQKRRMSEKVDEIKARVRLLKQAPFSIEKYINSVDDKTTIKQNNTKLEQFTPIYVVGKVTDLKTSYKIINTIDGEPGYRMIMPVYLQESQNNKNKKKVAFVDFGWIPNSVDVNSKLGSILNKDILIYGVVYYGDNKIGNQNKNDLTNGRMISLHLDELIKLHKNQTKLYDIEYLDFIVKRVNLDIAENPLNNINLTRNTVNIDELEYPKIKNKEEMLTWYIMPKTHRAYYTFWLTSTMLNLASNVYVWLYL